MLNDTQNDLGIVFIGIFLNDLSLLNDECIVMLKQINNYLEIKKDTNNYNSLSANRKWVLERHFVENEKKFNIEIKVSINTHFKS